MSINLKKHDPKLKSIQFLSIPLSKTDDYRKYVNHIKIEQDGSGVSTDSNRLHWSNETGLEPGYYKVHKCLKSKATIEKVAELDNPEFYYPDYTDLLDIPEVDGLDLDMDSNDFEVYTKVVRSMTRTTLNFKFVKELCSCDAMGIAAVIIPEPEKSYRDNELETTKPVHFVQKGYHAVIMPHTC